MTYELIICEKPNAALKIANAIADKFVKKYSYGTVSYYELTCHERNIIVASAVGHLYTLAEKDKKAWTYPIFGMEWVPTAKVNKNAVFTTKYLTILKKLAKDADSFTIATDFDVEGEVIGYNVLRFICKKKDANRMKFSTLTKDDLIKSYEHKNKTLEWGQVNAGITRHEMDWIYGINLSRALTLSIKKASGRFKLLSSGRVQGPALKILVDREKKISEFKSEPYWQLQFNGKVGKKSFLAIHEKDKIFDKKEAETIYAKIKDEKKAKVESVKNVQTRIAPPIPFDLTSLQLEAYKCLKISPKYTLDIAQVLYTEGAISYPRTSSQKLPKEIDYKKILNHLKKQSNVSKEVTYVLTKTKLIPNEGKKTDPAHPAIYPTGEIFESNDEKINLLYELIVRRFLSVFGEPAIRDSMNVELGVKDEPFLAKGIRTFEPGWFDLYGRFVMIKDEELPPLKKNQIVNFDKIENLEKETLPPKRYTAASIIKELEKRNLGTKATRAQIIENLYSRGYLNEKSIQATELGIEVCTILEKYCPDILDEKLTRHFEEEIDDIRENKKTTDSVIKEVKITLTKILNHFKKNELKIGKELDKADRETRNILTFVGKCPNCNGDLKIRKGKFGNFIACDKYPGCKTTFSLPSALVKPTGEKCETCGIPLVFIIKKRGAQKICIDPKCKSKFSEDKTKLKELECIESGKIIKKCPVCESNLVVRRSIYGAFLGCKGYPKCRYTEKKPDYKKKKI